MATSNQVLLPNLQTVGWVPTGYRLLLDSVPSLAAGLVFGIALIYAAYLVGLDPQNYPLQLAASSILAGVMGYRYYNSGKLMPAGFVLAISITMILLIFYRVAGITGKAASMQ